MNIINRIQNILKYEPTHDDYKKAWRSIAIQSQKNEEAQGQ